MGSSFGACGIMEEAPAVIVAWNVGGMGFKRLKAPKFDSTNPSLNTLLVRNNPSHTNSIILFQ